MPVTSPPVQEERTRDIPEEHAYLELIRTSEELSYRMDKVMEQFDLSAQQYNVLRILYVRRGEDHPVPYGTIRENLVTRVPDVSRLIDRMHQAKLVHRQRCPEDRRCIEVTLTAKGTAQCEDVDESLVDLYSHLLGHLDDGELAELKRLLKKVRDSQPDNV